MTDTPNRPDTLEDLQIPRTLAIEMLHQAQLSPSDEICGLVGGVDGEPVSAYPIANVADDRSTAFELDAQGHVEAQRQMRSRGESLLAVYHSHPTSPAEPSARDIDDAGYPDALFLIMSLNTKGVLEMRGWQRNADGVSERVLTVIDTD